MTFDVPVLMTIFNRPEQTAKVLGQVRGVRPTRLYVAADGPRAGRPDDAIKSRETRALFEAIDWDCRVHRLFRDENLGCRKAMISAINWFFESEERGIILEDDCFPDPTFFPYCSTLLERYAKEPKVMMISGDDFRFGRAPVEVSYYFTHYVPIWGWATWRRAWSLYDPAMTTWPDFKRSRRLYDILPDHHAAGYFERAYDRTYRNEIDTWDYQWSYTILKEGGLSICPNGNLVSNIGPQGVHMSGSPNKFLFMDRYGFDAQHIAHPGVVEALPAVDDAIYFSTTGESTPPGYYYKLITKASRVMNKINPKRWPLLRRG
jgi:hypothetical protein